MSDKKQKREEQMAQVREEILASRPPLTTQQKAGILAKEKKEAVRDPAGVKRKGRYSLEEGQTIKKEIAFNSYIAQIEEPRSFLNLLPEAMKQAVLSIPENLLNKDEDELLKILDAEYGYKPTASVESMRNNFWMEHDRVSVTRTEVINQSNIYLGIVSRDYFYTVVKDYPHVIAYILCRPPEYEAVMRGLLNLSTRKIRDVLNIPLQKADGSVQDAKIIELVLKAAAMVDLRAKGGYVQRSETKNLTLMKQENSYTNVFTAASSTKTFDISKIAENIDEKIAALEKEMEAIPGISHQAPEPSFPTSNNTIEATYIKVDDDQSQG